MNSHPLPLSIRSARHDDEAFLLSLLPRLADFPLPEWRTADEIARGGVQSLPEFLQRQPGVEIVQNGGPRAVFHSLRSIKNTLSICASIENYAPDAFLINLSNPMSRVTLAINRATKVRNVGICHEMSSNWAPCSNAPWMRA